MFVPVRMYIHVHVCLLVTHCHGNSLEGQSVVTVTNGVGYKSVVFVSSGTAMLYVLYACMFQGVAPARLNSYDWLILQDVQNL